MERALAHVRDAVAAGARLLCGGRPLESGGGFYLEPTVLAEVPETAACMREETFAPVAPVCPFETEAEALAQAIRERYSSQEIEVVEGGQPHYFYILSAE